MSFLTKSILVVCLLTFTTKGVQAQTEKPLTSGNSINVSIPIGTMESEYNFGVGVYANFDYKFNEFLTGRFDLGWNYFIGDDIIDQNTGFLEETQMNVWEFTGGLRANINVFYAEARGGYFTGVNSWGFVPAIGVRLGKIDIQGNVTLAGDTHWAGVRLGYYWGN